MGKEIDLSHDNLISSIDYNEITGVFVWKKKVETDGHKIAWNKKYAGKEAGTVGLYMGKKYRSIQINGIPYLAHRLAWFYKNKAWPDKVDHEDGNGLNNSYENLRNTTMQGNQRNRRMSKNNKSGITGVCWSKTHKRWLSSIKIDRQPQHLGVYEDKFEAICARKSAENYYGFHENHGMNRPL